MENFLPVPKEGSKLKGGEKYFGYLVATGLFFGFIMLAKYLFPIITSAIVNTTDMVWAALKLVAVVVLTGGVLVALWKGRNLISYWFNVLIKYLWTASIEANPIAGMKYAYQKWMNQNDEVNDTIKILEGREKLIKDKMNQRSTEAERYFAAGLKAKEMSEKSEGDEAQDLIDTANTNAAMAQRRKESMDIFIPKLQTIQSALNFLRNLHKAWEKGLKNLKDDIQIKEEDLADLKTIAGAFSKAQAIISGNTNERIIYEESIKAYGNQLNMFVGQCKRFTEQAKDYAMNVDVQNAIEADKGKKFLSDYNMEKFRAELDYTKVLATSPKRGQLQMSQASNQFQKSLDTPMTNVPNQFTDLN